MTAMDFFGCTFIAFGPPLALCCFTIIHDPVRIIIVIASAFFWLLSLLVSSSWWTIIYPLQDTLEFSLVFSVLFQEAFRFLVYFILRKAEGGLKMVTEADTALIDNKHILAYVAGLGFGIMSGAFAVINVLADSAGPGVVGLLGGGDTQYFVIASSLIALAFILLHTVWNVVFFDALDKRNFHLILAVVILHLAASLVTLVNKTQLYWVSIPCVYVILLISSWLAFRTAEGRLDVQELFSRRRPVTVEVRD